MAATSNQATVGSTASSDCTSLAKPRASSASWTSEMSKLRYVRSGMFTRGAAVTSVQVSEVASFGILRCAFF
ncbi:hypothetical protein RHECNPAF_730083 [Rhizobium etli CNPAF512]|nr:hypothetical protein RHECNPAF_730083 [Rhizobium etli CNPAF512]